MGTISTSWPWSWIDSTSLGYLVLAFYCRRSCFADRLLCLVVQNSGANTLRMERNDLEICTSFCAGRFQHVVDSFLLSPVQQRTNCFTSHPTRRAGCGDYDPGSSLLVAFIQNAVTRLAARVRTTTPRCGITFYALHQLAHSFEVPAQLCADAAVEYSLGSVGIRALLDRSVDHFSANANARHDDDAFDALIVLRHQHERKQSLYINSAARFDLGITHNADHSG